MARKLQEYLDDTDYAKRSAALDSLNSSKPTWDNEKNYSPVQTALDAYKNREKFSYDLNGDMLYQQYKDQYINQGKQAMMDAMGQASAMTGGYGNSYAQTVGQQTYQGYLQGLNDKIPELYQLAYDKYNQEGDDLLTQYSLEKDKYDTAYGEHQNDLSNWYTDRSYESDMMNNAYNRAFAQLQEDTDNDQWNDSYKLQKDQFAWEQIRADQSDEISALKTENSTLKNITDNIEVDEYGDPIQVDGKSYGKQTVSGFRTKKGDNFKINGYEVENKGELTDKDYIAALDKLSKSTNGTITSYRGDMYYRYNGKYYRVGATNYIFNIGEKKGYSNLKNSLYQQ